MATRTTAVGRMFAWLQEEVPATLLEAYRRASLPVYEVMDAAEARRLECATEGLNPWTVPPAVRAEFLCAWNAFVLQTLGNEIIDADYKASPATVGFVPSLTAQQVLAFYSQVEEWLTRARQAHANPDFRLDVRVPAALPDWKTSTLEPWSPALVDGLLRAMNSVGDHAAAAMAFLPDAAAEPAQQAQLNRIRHLHASAESKARYASDLHGNGSSREVHSKVQPYIRDAIELFYQLGQLIADPSLVARAEPESPAPSAAAPRLKVSLEAAAPPLSTAPPSSAAPTPSAAPVEAAAPASASPAKVVPPSKPDTREAAARPPRDGSPSRPPPPGPGKAGFDEWCLTDPEARAQLKDDPQAVEALLNMWRTDTDPNRTLAIHAEIRDALEDGVIAYASDGKERLGYFHCCPWGSIYVANDEVMLGGRLLQPMQRFVYNVGGSPFRRGVLLGNFAETDRVRYGSHKGRPKRTS